ncbi:MAG: M43 family zinc metalloprotease, partial [Bacteroidota bacterium]
MNYMFWNRISAALLLCLCFSPRLYSQQVVSPCAVSGTDQSEMPQHPDGISVAGTDTFDVVFHVIHLGQPIGSGSNISDEQIKSSLFSLNRDFGAWPIHDSIAIAPNGANSEVFFRLACTAPDGSPTTGINRVDAGSFPDYATQGFNFKTGNAGNYKQLADLSHWPQNRYINIWITHRLETFLGVTSGGGGFNAATAIFQQGYGGVYMVFRYVGCDVDGSQGFVLFNKYGKLITHEVGHYLGLLHTFEGESCTETDCATQGDRVCDTEPHSNSVPNDPSCGEYAECTTREPVENIMN